MFFPTALDAHGDPVFMIGVVAIIAFAAAANVILRTPLCPIPVTVAPGDGVALQCLFYAVVVCVLKCLADDLIAFHGWWTTSRKAPPTGWWNDLSL